MRQGAGLLRPGSLSKDVFPKERGQICLSLHQSGEDYLEAILMLQKEKGMVRSVDVARHMGVSKPVYATQ